MRQRCRKKNRETRIYDVKGYKRPQRRKREKAEKKKKSAKKAAN